MIDSVSCGAYVSPRPPGGRSRPLARRSSSVNPRRISPRPYPRTIPLHFQHRTESEVTPHYPARSISCITHPPSVVPKREKDATRRDPAPLPRTSRVPLVWTTDPRRARRASATFAVPTDIHGSRYVRRFAPPKANDLILKGSRDARDRGAGGEPIAP